MKKTIIFLLVGAVIFCTSMAFKGKDAIAGYQIGDVATDFNLRGTDEKMHSLKALENVKGYIIIFTCNHCPFAKMYEDRIIALQNEFGPKGFPVIAINPNDPAAEPADSFEKMQERAKEKKFNFPYLFDEGQRVYPKYGATKTPHVYLLNSHRVVKYIGAIDDNARNSQEVKQRFLANAINSLLAGKEVKTKTTKAIGCSIKSSK